MWSLTTVSPFPPGPAVRLSVNVLEQLLRLPLPDPAWFEHLSRGTESDTLELALLVPVYLVTLFLGLPPD